MHPTRRLAIALAAGTLAVPLLSTPTAHAAGSYDCFFGDRTTAADDYQISGNSCDGAGYSDVVITVLSGSAAGSHRCRTAFSWNGFLSANGCRPA
ncbi:hypothetical protein [Actinomadura rudentiformis]|uniref:Uncharacterized protein n=1 Tax=Actinomadura rudentiformis TaxID=359158 RepID=A0A6H9Z358_9ACTN|nr:hypothetical protein [Actinomadura rudentiformis]KAB2352512.1 hypothetical protein F8566_02190 [Actinomadura rudentiformis]